MRQSIKRERLRSIIHPPTPQKKKPHNKRLLRSKEAAVAALDNTNLKRYISPSQQLARKLATEQSALLCQCTLRLLFPLLLTFVSNFYFQRDPLGRLLQRMGFEACNEHKT